MMIGTLCLLCITFSCKKEVKTEDRNVYQYDKLYSSVRLPELVAMTEDARCVSHEYADIVQHGTLKQKIGVYVELRVAVCYLKSLSCHVGAMA